MKLSILSSSHECLQLLLVENLTFHESRCLRKLPVDVLVAYQRRDVLSSPGCAVHILRVGPSGSYQQPVSNVAWILMAKDPCRDLLRLLPNLDDRKVW